MLVFQQAPCRLYPQITNLIKKQFPKSFFIHEVYSFKDNTDKHNPLKISKNDYIFPRCDFIYGIFDENKIKKENGDFWFTIKLPKNKVMQEFFCAIKYYGSLQFGFASRQNAYDSYLHKLLRPLYNFTLKELVLHYDNKKINHIVNDEIYNLRMNLINNEGFDYIGDFDQWGRTIKEIKESIGLDLSSLSMDNTYSYKIV